MLQQESVARERLTVGTGQATAAGRVANVEKPPPSANG